MAARSDDPDVSPESAAAVAAVAAAGGEIWGTQEELLLASAVSRHGTASWESVAMEVQSRSSPSAAARFTATSCRLRYRLLHRRFSAAAENGDGGGGGGDGDEEPAAGRWVEELRKLRVAELRREVERRDLSIGSLQSKVKRLKEERERSLSGETKPAVEEEQEAGKGSPEESSGEDRVSGEESGRSCKESNSSDLKRPGHDAAAAAADGDVAVKEELAAGEVAVKEEASGESVAGSKEAAADAEKESSDVQSSASPSRRKRRKRGKGAGEEADAEAASPSASVPLPTADSEPLVAFLESVRVSKSGSVFERRLESQESAKYRGTIRRHVDLEMIRSKLECEATGRGACYASASEFYRDLLLLCTNALVFFPRGSPEHAAAVRTRTLVSRHMSASLWKDHPGTAGKAAAAAAAAPEKAGTEKAKADAEIAGPLLEKATPIIVCRKRSSIAKAAAAAAKEEKMEKAEEKQEEEEKENDDKKGGTKDKARGLRTNKSRGLVRNAAPSQKTGKASERSEGTKKSDKKGGGGSGGAAAGGVAKKRNAVDFLNRMKQNAAPSTERVSLLETLKLSAATEQKKSGKGDGRKDASGSGSKKAAADTSGRRVGRPPKRAAAPPTPPQSKRARDDKSSRKRGKK